MKPPCCKCTHISCLAPEKVEIVLPRVHTGEHYGGGMVSSFLVSQSLAIFNLPLHSILATQTSQAAVGPLTFTFEELQATCMYSKPSMDPVHPGCVGAM